VHEVLVWRESMQHSNLGSCMRVDLQTPSSGPEEKSVEMTLTAKRSGAEEPCGAWPIECWRCGERAMTCTETFARRSRATGQNTRRWYDRSAFVVGLGPLQSMHRWDTGKMMVEFRTAIMNRKARADRTENCAKGRLGRARSSSELGRLLPCVSLRKRWTFTIFTAICSHRMHSATSHSYTTAPTSSCPSPY